MVAASCSVEHNGHTGGNRSSSPAFIHCWIADDACSSLEGMRSFAKFVEGFRPRTHRSDFLWFMSPVFPDDQDVRSKIFPNLPLLADSFEGAATCVRELPLGDCVPVAPVPLGLAPLPRGRGCAEPGQQTAYLRGGGHSPASGRNPIQNPGFQRRMRFADSLHPGAARWP